MRGDDHPDLSAASRRLTCLRLSGVSVVFVDGFVITLKEYESPNATVTHESGKEDAARGLRDRCGGEGYIHRSTTWRPAYRSRFASSVSADFA